MINICIEKNIGFVYDPIFSRNELQKFYHAESLTLSERPNMLVSNIEKNITANDIRARIISIPRMILEKLPKDKEKFNIVFNGNKLDDVKISTDRRYFSRGISEMYRKYSLLKENCDFCPRKSVWNYDGNIIYIDVV